MAIIYCPPPLHAARHSNDLRHPCFHDTVNTTPLKPFVITVIQHNLLELWDFDCFNHSVSE